MIALVLAALGAAWSLVEQGARNVEMCPDNGHGMIHSRVWDPAYVAKVLKYPNHFNASEPYCAVDELPGAPEQFAAFLEKHGGWPAVDAETSALLDRFKAKSDGSVDMILFSIDQYFFDQPIAVEFVRNLFCRLHQLQLLDKSLVFLSAREKGDAVVAKMRKGWDRLCHGAKCPAVFAGAGWGALMEALGDADHFGSGGRIGKMLFPLYLLEQHGLNVLVSDADTVWLRDPLPYLKRVDADLVAMQDGGCVELNTGFLRYRPSEPVKAMLRTALGTMVTGATASKSNDWIHHSDQYLLNCAWAYHVPQGLTYAMLDGRFTFADMPPDLHRSPWVDTAAAPLEETAGPVNLKSEPLPLYVWHTSGFTTVGRPGAGLPVVALLRQTFGWNVGQGGCTTGLGASELRAAERRLDGYCKNGGEYAPTCRNAPNHAGTCAATVGEFLKAASWTVGTLTQSSAELVGVDRCLAHRLTELQQAHGACAPRGVAGAGPLLEALALRGPDEPVEAALVAACWGEQRNIRRDQPGTTIDLHVEAGGAVVSDKIEALVSHNISHNIVVSHNISHVEALALRGLRSAV